jgi:hypothetical protein
MGRREMQRLLVGKPEGKIQERPRHGWVNVKLDIGEIGWGGWIRLVLLKIGIGGGLL